MNQLTGHTFGIQWKNEELEKQAIAVVHALTKETLKAKEMILLKDLIDDIISYQGMIDNFELLCFFCRGYELRLISLTSYELRDEPEPKKEMQEITEKIVRLGNKAIEIVPDDPDVALLIMLYEILFRSYFYLEDFRKAREYANKVLQLQPDNERALKSLEKIEEFIEETESHNVVLQVEQLQPSFRERGANLFLKGRGREPTSDERGRLLPAGQFPRGSPDILPHLEKALEQSRNAMIMQSEGEWELFVEGTEEEVIEFLNDPEKFGATMRRLKGEEGKGKTRAREDDLGLARIYIKDWLKKIQSGYRFDRDDTIQFFEDTDRAWKIIDSVLKNTPDHEEARIELARWHLCQASYEGRFKDGTKKAIKHMEKVVEIVPERATYRCGLGLLYARRGKKRRAIEQLEKAVELEPGNIDFRKELDRIKS